MPKPLHKIDMHCLDRLKSELELRVGITVKNRSDCQRMSSEIKAYFGVYISESTIRRVYLNDGNQNHFYIHTLDRLCEVLENNLTWERYCVGLNRARSNYSYLEGELSLSVQSSLLFINMEHQAWRQIYTYFDRMAAEVNDENCNYIQTHIGLHLFRIAKNNKDFEIDVYRKLAQHPLVRKSFFEQCADPEFALPNYQVGLALYRKYSTNNNHSLINDICFERCMQFLNGGGRSSKKERLRSFEEINADFKLEQSVENGIHAYNIGRLICVLMAGRFDLGISAFDSTFSDIIIFVRKNKGRWDGFERRIILFYIFQGLWRLKMEEMYFYMAEKEFGVSFLSKDNFQNSLNKFLFEKEPNALIWYRRNNVV